MTCPQFPISATTWPHEEISKSSTTFTSIFHTHQGFLVSARTHFIFIASGAIHSLAMTILITRRAKGVDEGEAISHRSPAS
jgi:hypothetical protein